MKAKSPLKRIEYGVTCKSVMSVSYTPSETPLSELLSLRKKDDDPSTRIVPFTGKSSLVEYSTAKETT